MTTPSSRRWSIGSSVVHRRADVDDGRLERRPPGEREELPGELARTGRRRRRSSRHPRGRRRGPSVSSLDQRREAADGRERVVEVVRDAARDATDGLEALGVGELRVERDPLGDVGELAGEAERPAG